MTGQSNREVQGARRPAVRSGKVGRSRRQATRRSGARLCFVRITRDGWHRRSRSSHGLVGRSRRGLLDPQHLLTAGSRVLRGGGRECPDQSIDRSELLALTAEIVAAHVGNNAIAGVGRRRADPVGLRHAERAGHRRAGDAVELTPAVPIRRSVTDDYIVCLEDGKKLKMLKRHLMTDHGLTPEEYRAKWGLKPDYPMVAPNYSAQRQALAKQIGLGRKPAPPPPAPKPGRRRKTAA